ncbi:carbon-nitrogen hydrolase family protein [Paenisporosarcina sp. TG20]|uniref:carbon-nitrogen hydrolase family protein n=1 Tax=Paenisporosarcina sp. TG20 TaxID=1211706 RepID=UPI0003106E54|nr:carbon-nitrogen hydrolase family protein [Paenisporosarcina sp. TG20]
MDKQKVMVAAIQMNSVPYDLQGNLKMAEQLITQALQKNGKLIVLPELFNTGYRVEDKDTEMAEEIPGYTTTWLTEIAKKHNVYFSTAILEKGAIKGIVFDTAILVGPEGLIGSYRKTHLWDLENIRFTKGEDFPVFETPIGNIGMQICYEIGFPEGARILALKGADIIVYPSAFGKARRYAWDIASRARALENGIFIIAANRTGTEKGETIFGGGSRIVDPFGEILVQTENESDVILIEIELNKVTEQRRMLPYLRDLNKNLFPQGLAKKPF